MAGHGGIYNWCYVAMHSGPSAMACIRARNDTAEQRTATCTFSSRTCSFVSRLSSLVSRLSSLVSPPAADDGAHRGLNANIDPLLRQAWAVAPVLVGWGRGSRNTDSKTPARQPVCPRPQQHLPAAGCCQRSPTAHHDGCTRQPQQQRKEQVQRARRRGCGCIRLEEMVRRGSASGCAIGSRRFAVCQFWLRHLPRAARLLGLRWGFTVAVSIFDIRCW